MRRRYAGIVLFAVALVVSLIGIALVYTASHRIFGYRLALRQLLWLLLGVGIALGMASVDPKNYYKFRWPLYLLGIALLLLTLFYGRQARGGRRWLSFQGFNLQPAELMKFFLILVIAGISEKFEKGFISPVQAVLSVGTAVFLPVILIFLQPNLGMTLVYLAVLVGWFFNIGWRREGFAIVSFGLAVVVGVLVTLFSFGGLVGQVVDGLV